MNTTYKLLLLLCALQSLWAFTERSISSFQRITSQKRTQLYMLETLFNGVFGAKRAENPAQNRINSLKEELITECRLDSPDRSKIEALIDQLSECSPVSATSSSALLQKKWALIWTTEKEINFFIDRGISDGITQTISGSSLKNSIPFKNGGEFGVSGVLSIPDQNGVRTLFEFKEAVLDLGKWGKYKFPPVGKGWFDTVYLDESLRVDTNSRNDILICEPAKEP